MRNEAMKRTAVLRGLRKSHRLDQSQLALLMRVSQQTVSAWERGTRTPDRDAVMRLATLFNRDFHELDELFLTGGNAEWQQR